MQICSVGIDQSKTSFHLVALGAARKVLIKKKLTGAPPTNPSDVFIDLLSAGTSVCGESAPSLLAFPNHFTHIKSWEYVEE